MSPSSVRSISFPFTIVNHFHTRIYCKRRENVKRILIQRSIRETCEYRDSRQWRGLFHHKCERSEHHWKLHEYSVRAYKKNVLKQRHSLRRSRKCRCWFAEEWFAVFVQIRVRNTETWNVFIHAPLHSADRITAQSAQRRRATSFPVSMPAFRSRNARRPIFITISIRPARRIMLFQFYFTFSLWLLASQLSHCFHWRFSDFLFGCHRHDNASTMHAHESEKSIRQRARPRDYLANDNKIFASANEDGGGWQIDNFSSSFYFSQFAAELTHWTRTAPSPDRRGTGRCMATARPTQGLL